MIINFSKDNYLITTDRNKIDINAVCSFLAKSYWASNRKKETILTSIENSLCFSLFREDKQIGIARVITDCATFAYLCDVYIDQSYRGKGLGHWLMECILSHPSLRNIGRFCLVTKDAHDFYRNHGFSELKHVEKYMEKLNID